MFVGRFGAAGALARPGALNAAYGSGCESSSSTTSFLDNPLAPLVLTLPLVPLLCTAPLALRATFDAATSPAKLVSDELLLDLLLAPREASAWRRRSFPSCMRFSQADSSEGMFCNTSRTALSTVRLDNALLRRKSAWHSGHWTSPVALGFLVSLDQSAMQV